MRDGGKDDGLKVHSVTWDLVTKPKCNEGLGTGNLNKSTALRGKWL